MPKHEQAQKTQSPAHQQVSRPPKGRLESQTAGTAPATIVRQTLNGAHFPSAGEILLLQRSIGNRAVGQLMSRQRTAIQFKLTVGAADDPYEREADRVAAQVMSSAGAGAPSDVSRKDDDQAAQRKAILPAITPLVQRRNNDLSDSFDAGAGVEQQLNSSRHSGSPLPAKLRADLEPHYGVDFKNVRIHTDTQADTLNRSLGAAAFTHQNHVYMSAGSYNPQSASGRQLLAHELTHVVQQGAAKHTPDAQRTLMKRDGAAVQRSGIQQTMPGNRISLKKKKMYLDFVKMKRMDPRFDNMIRKKLGMKLLDDGGGGTYGHWWTEVGATRGGNFIPQKSYGWWPANGVQGIKKTFQGVPGALNSGEGDKDPHHGHDAPTMFHPVAEVDTDKETYDQIRDRITKGIHDFAHGFKGQWHWRLGWGKNCHTFQQALKTANGLHYTKASSMLIDPAETVRAQKAKEEAEAVQEAKSTGTPFKIPHGLDVADLDGKSHGAVRAGDTIYITGVTQVNERGWKMCQYIYNEQTCWVSAADWKQWEDVDYPEFKRE